MDGLPCLESGLPPLGLGPIDVLGVVADLALRLVVSGPAQHTESIEITFGISFPFGLPIDVFGVVSDPVDEMLVTDFRLCMVVSGPAKHMQQV